MPFKGINDTNLPSYIKTRSPDTKKKWVSIYNTIAEKEGDSKATVISNTWLQNQIKQKEFVAATHNTMHRLVFEVSKENGEFIKQSEAGDSYIDFVLSDVWKDSKGRQMELSVLEKMANQINKGDLVIGDIDHIEYDKIMNGFYDTEKTVELLKNKPGIAKAVKAVVEKGKLWVRAFIDKRYSKIIREKANGVSLEGLFETREDGRVIDGNLTGFTFAVSSPQVNPRAVIA